MARIAISGYYGFENAGDEAVLLSIIQALGTENTENMPLEICVLSHNPQATAQRYGVEAVNRWSLKAIIQTLKSADVLISGGGSLLQDVTSKKSVAYYLGVIGIAQFLRKPVVFYSQGVGPVNGALNRFLMRLICNGVKEIYVRDEASKDELQAMGVRRPPIKVVMDPVVSMELTEEEKRQGCEIIDRGIQSANKPLAGLYLRGWKTENAYLDEVVMVCEALDKMGYLPVFVPMHYPDDVTAVAPIKERLQACAVFLEDHYSPQEILAMTAKMDFVIAMRLHGLIMAANAGTPYLGISYDPKIEAFIQSSNFGQVMAVQTFNAQDFVPLLKEFVEDLSQHQETLKKLKHEFDQRTKQPAKAVMALLAQKM